MTSKTWIDALIKADQAVIETTRRLSIPVLRIALGIVYVWFGLLKVFGVSPVAALVLKSAYFLPPWLAVGGMGVFETIIGLGLLSGRAMRITLAMFFVQILATFLTVVTRPDLLIEHGDPLLLSMNGEFVLKNLVLIAAGMTIASALPKVRAQARRSG